MKRGLSAGALLACLAAPPVSAAELMPSPSSAAAPAPAAEPPYHPPEDPRLLLIVTPEMRHFFSGRMNAPPNSSDQLRQLIDAIVQPKGLGFIYDGEGAFDPQTTFRLRRGNCVSFAMLVVAMAREFGF